MTKTIREVALLLVQRLHAQLAGDADALDDLRAELAAEGVTDETLAGALAWLRAGAAGETEELLPSSLPGGPSARVLSREESRLVSPDAFGYLLSLAAEGKLETEQLERILARLGESEWPLSLAEVQEMVWREAAGGPSSEIQFADETTTIH